MLEKYRKTLYSLLLSSLSDIARTYFYLQDIYINYSSLNNESNKGYNVFLHFFNILELAKL